MMMPLQVTAVVGGGGGGGGGERERPALGLAWASVVGTRITLHRDQTVDNEARYCKVGLVVTISGDTLARVLCDGIFRS